MNRLQYFKEITVTDNIKLGNTLSFGQDKAYIKIDNDGILYFKDTEVSEVSLKFLQTLASSNATSKLILANNELTIGNIINKFSIDVTSQGDFTITNTGLMGFGTLSPTHKFHFIGNTIGDTFTIENNKGDSQLKLNALDKFGNINSSGRLSSGWTYNQYNDISGSYLTLDTYVNRDSTSMHDMILKNGKVGINVSYPSDYLQVGGSATIKDKLSFYGSSCRIEEVGNELLFYDSIMSHGYKISDFKTLYDDLTLLSSDPILTKVKDVSNVLTFDSSDNLVTGTFSIKNIDSKIDYNQSFKFSKTGYNDILMVDEYGLRVPRGNMSMRPNLDSSGDTVGYIRYNTSINRFEGYELGAWSLLSGSTNINDMDGDTGITVDSSTFDDIDLITLTSKNKKMLVVDGSNNNVEIHKKLFFTDSSGSVGNDGTQQLILKSGYDGLNFKNYQDSSVLNINKYNKATFYGLLECGGNLQTLYDIIMYGDTIDMSGNKQTIKIMDNSLNVLSIATNGKPKLITIDTLDNNEVITTTCNIDISGNLDISGSITIKGAINIPGNMSLGTNLDVSGNVKIDGDIDLSKNKTNILLYDNSNNSLIYKANGIDYIKYDTTSGNEAVVLYGNLGIGRNPDNIVSLDISGSGAIRVPSGTTLERPDLIDNDGLIRYNSSTRHIEGFANHIWVNLDMVPGGNSYDPKIINELSDSYVLVNNDNTIDFFTQSTNQMTIDSIGNIGIGTSNPNYLLDVNGNICARGDIDCFGGIEISGKSKLTGPIEIASSYLDVDLGNGNFHIGGILDTSGSLHIRGNSHFDNSANFIEDVYFQKPITMYDQLGVVGISNLNGGINISSGQFSVTHTSGDTIIKGGLNVDGYSSLNATTIGGICQINHSCNISGQLNIQDKLNMDNVGNIHIGKALDVSENVIFYNELIVTGETKLNGGLRCDTNKFIIDDVTGSTTIGGILTVNNNSILNNNLDVTGTTTLGTLDVTGACNLSNEFSISSNMFIVDSSGNVGIGTANPNSKLQITDGNLTVISGNVGIGIDNPTAKVHIPTPDDTGIITPLFNFHNASGYGIDVNSRTLAAHGNTLDFVAKDYDDGNNTIRNTLILDPLGRVGIACCVCTNSSVSNYGGSSSSSCGDGESGDLRWNSVVLVGVLSPA